MILPSPQWSSSSTARARARSMSSGVSLRHGSAVSHSRYVRATEYSAAAGGIFVEPVQLAQGLPVRLLGHAGGLDLLAKLGQLLAPLVALAELLLDRLQLLAQVVLPLGLGHLALDLRVDLRPQLEDLGFLRERLHQRLEARLDVGRLEERLALDRGQGGQGGGDQVDRPPRVAGPGDERQQIVGQRRGQLDDPLEERVRLPAERLGLHVVGRRHDVRHALDPGPEVRRRLRELHHAEPLEPLDDQADRAVGLLEHPVDRRDGARPVQLLGRGRLLRRRRAGSGRRSAGGRGRPRPPRGRTTAARRPAG